MEGEPGREMKLPVGRRGLIGRGQAVLRKRFRMLISVIVPCFNEEEVLPALYAQLSAVWEALSLDVEVAWELICVNDGSRDRTLELLLDLHRRDPRVKVINLSRNFKQQIATSAGLDYARGDAVIIMDADLQDPPEVIGDLIAEWRKGFDVVYAVRRTRAKDTRFKRGTSRLFYRLFRYFLRVDIPLDTGDFRLMDQRVVQELRHLRERHRFLRGLSNWVGFRQTGVYFDRPERYAGETKYPVFSMLQLTLDAVTGFSYRPLYLASCLGLLLSLVALISIVLVFFLRAFGTYAFTGQATTLISVLLLGGVQLICLGILGAYLGRIYDEVKGRPLYIVERAYGLEAPPETGAKPARGP